MKIQSLIIATMLSLMSFLSIAGEKLTGDQIKALFSERTYDIEKVGVNKNYHLSAYTSFNGKYIVYIPWKDKQSKRKWWVEGNMFCANHPKRDDFCLEIMLVSDGVYHSLESGKHRSTLSNFRDGNQL